MKLIVSTFLVYKVKKCLLKSGKVKWKGSDYKYSTILFIVSIKLETKNKECLLFQFYEIDSVYLF